MLADLTARVWKSNIELGYDYGPLTLVFIDTGLEYPEIRKFVKEFPEYLENTYNIPVKLDIIRPKMNFKEVIEKYGYPVVSKRIAGYVNSARNNPNCARKKFLTGEIPNMICGNGKYSFLLDSPFKISDYCCHKMKVENNVKYQKNSCKKVILATMAEESNNRKNDWIKNGCNSFNGTLASKPMSFWTEQDVLKYIKISNLPYCSVYGDIVPINNQESLFNDCKLCLTGCNRTGCMYCAGVLQQYMFYHERTTKKD